MEFTWEKMSMTRGEKDLFEKTNEQTKLTTCKLFKLYHILLKAENRG